MRKRRNPLEAETRKVFRVVELLSFQAEVIFGHHQKALLWATRWRSSWIFSLFRCHIQLQWTRCRRRRTSLEKRDKYTLQLIKRHNLINSKQERFVVDTYLQRVDSIHALIVPSTRIPRSVLIDGNRTAWSGKTLDDVRSLSRCCASTWPVVREYKYGVLLFISFITFDSDDE